MRTIKVAHPYASPAFRMGMADKLAEHADLQDRLEPDIPGEGQMRSRLEPQGELAAHDMTSGPVGLVHPTVASRLAEYEKNLGSAHLLQLPSATWRRLNVAYSIRHPGGVAQELGIRALVNNIGFISLTRGTKFGHYLKEWAESNPDPAIKTQWQRLEANTGGTYASFTSGQGKHIPLRQLEDTVLERPAKWWVKHEAQKITGMPLKAITTAVRGTNHFTNQILRIERKYIEHPPVVAGMGKHFAEEFQRTHGKRMKVFGAMNEVEKEFLQGRLNPKAIDHAAEALKEQWGDWKASSPKFRRAQAMAPFLRWFTNALRFIYHTMPVNHPIKTGLLVALEGATREQRLTEGQEYEPGFNLGKGKLPAYQQGSFPIGPGKRYGAEYYSSEGAVSAGLEGFLGAAAPWATGIYDTMHGIDSLTHRPLEEVNPKTGKKEPITGQGKLALLGALAAFESFAPPYRYAKELTEKPASYVFRPFRTEKEHKEGQKKEKGLGGSLGGSLGGNLGGKL